MDIAKLPILLSITATDRVTALTCWYKLLMDYSNRHLSVPGDKLVAINGLMNIFARWIGGAYIHGIWEVDLLHGLLWGTSNRWVSGPGEFILSFALKPSKTRRVVTGRAPSWSWASADGFQTHFHHFFLTDSEEIHAFKDKWKYICEHPHASVQVASLAEHVEYSSEYGTEAFYLCQEHIHILVTWEDADTT